MVNSNPETVSTDYDTSDRLYFEPLDAAAVLAVCEREQPHGVVIQFGGQTPLKLAATLEEAGVPILGTPFGAIDLAEDRERFGRLTDELGIRVPPWGMADDADAGRAGRRARSAIPVLVRPSYVLGGRAMRICYSAEQVRDAMRDVQGRVLVDRFLEDAMEIDVDALCRRKRLLHRRRDAARRGGRRALGRLGVRAAGAVARPDDVLRGLPRRAAARARARRRRPAERAARGRGRRPLRARGEPARVAHGSVRIEGDGHQPRRGGVPARGRRAHRRSSRCRRSGRRRR